MYVPTLARFQSRDPLSADGVDLLYPPPVLNPYRYVQNNPTNHADPSGLNPVSLMAVEMRGLIADGYNCSNAPKQYCVYEFEYRSGKAKECHGYDLDDIVCCDCPTGISPKCDPKLKITLKENNKTKCVITFVPVSKSRRCKPCPPGGKDCVTGGVIQ